MPDLIRLETKDWELTVWCSDIIRRQRALNNTLARRGMDVIPTSTLKLEQSVQVKSLSVIDNDLNINDDESLNSIPLPQALFFENCQYQFEWVFKNKVDQAKLIHKLKAINNSFRFSNRNNIHVLTGTINTGNDLGCFGLPFCYEVNGQSYKQTVSFEVLPVKMDLHTDLEGMYRAIDSNYPLWRFSLANKTQQNVSKGEGRGYFPLLWLAYFEELREKMMAGLKVITNVPHSRLQTISHKVKADRLKGRLSHKIVEQIKQDHAQGLYQKRYQQNRKQLSVDTPENRFIKMVVKTTKNRLDDFYSKLTLNNLKSDQPVISDAFLETLKAWSLPLKKIQSQSFLSDVDDFSGLTKESLVLQQKTGYSTVYRVWQELKFYLDAFAGQSSVSIKSVAEIYEVWCFLELRRILVDELGFEESAKRKAQLQLKDFEYDLKDGLGGAFEFVRDDSIEVRLAHEPVFKVNTKPIRTWQVPQKPDILLEVTFPDGRQFIWLFDAKYRIKPDRESDDGLVDYDEDAFADQLVPEDAINQMHRYRDALIHINKDNSAQKSRPVCGAFALYPGCVANGQTENPYKEAIKEIGIGAFPLLPSANGDGSKWLAEFLINQIGKPMDYDAYQHSDTLYVQDSMRIPSYGMKQVLYPDLVLTLALGPGRSKEYKQQYEDGTARWYHIPKNVFEGQLGNHVVKEVAYLAIGTISPGQSTRTIKRVWKVRSVDIKQRCDITKEQAGKASNSEKLYYLFELGECLTLSEEVQGMPTRQFRSAMKLTRLDAIYQNRHFSYLPNIYTEIIRT
ncbi:DUF2357 domain-containing protein [Kangiella koreensis]|uniref:DUF2357 domain-containing protein n=1 Tax=Kangiella koreensis (strain DSM 16069 / JCM 12317 / KCTC 12182 / SW-125) TaxID=523791 RepID=C7RCX5_KANKD|nr:DUF2357 domain-containing protein [Kangiella koreensis]ACV27117.1 protein of unknown function DUF524 [Kangiella koreensis DSM 16069]